MNNNYNFPLLTYTQQLRCSHHHHNHRATLLSLFYNQLTFPLIFYSFL